MTTELAPWVYWVAASFAYLGFAGWYFRAWREALSLLLMFGLAVLIMVTLYLLLGGPL